MRRSKSKSFDKRLISASSTLRTAFPMSRSEWKISGCDFSVAEKNLALVKKKGLDGLEAIYQANSPGENNVFTDIADRLGLLKSAGSDFHGSNKPTVTIGMDAMLCLSLA